MWWPLSDQGGDRLLSSIADLFQVDTRPSVMSKLFDIALYYLNLTFHAMVVICYDFISLEWTYMRSLMI